MKQSKKKRILKNIFDSSQDNQRNAFSFMRAKSSLDTTQTKKEKSSNLLRRIIKNQKLT